MDYNSYHADVANTYINVKNKKVLVVGCNRGKDVSYFVDFGATEVCGIDIIEEVGQDYTHEKAKYYQMSAEKMNIEDNTFDLVYCFATMEHIINIEKAFAEMVRVTQSEGIIYCLASPLWNSRQGHHKSNIFDVDKYPWIHLTLTKEEMQTGCYKGKIDYPDWVTNIDSHIDYMLNPQYFNRCSARDYVKVCDNLENVDIITNNLDLEAEHNLARLSVDDFKKLLEKNINSTELLAVTHTFVGRKLALKEVQHRNKQLILSDKTDTIKQYEIELQKAHQKVEAMKTSKFWKLRSL
ncbi:MAG: class I SAM-dependent methyltransferase, partial [Crocosphaera sp.]|nr:class I SAM-dependent methyltransferase [Crocosphaera sp.]